jgi:soluble lytic murein transglycosylase-like protein
MQIRPVVIEELIEQGRISAHEERELTDPIVNVRLGVSYLAHLSDLFGAVELAPTAYNWGPTRLKKKIAARGEMPVHYVTKVLTAQRSLEEQLALIG